MTTTLRPDADLRAEGTSGKAVWTRPVLDVVDVVTVTLGGGNGVADGDPPNRPAS